MADSLRDQLLALGLAKKPEPRPRESAPRKPGAASQRANEPAQAGNAGVQSNRASTAARDQKPASRPPSRPKAAATEHPPREPDLAQAYAARARHEREERLRLEREAQERARDKRERRAKLAELLEGKSLNASDADLARNFSHGAKIRRIYVTAEQLPKLNAGELGVVQKDGRYLLVPRAIALEVQALLPEAMVLLPDPNAPAEDDIPPDLIW